MGSKVYDLFSVEGKKALVTGGSAGMGRAMASAASDYVHGAIIPVDGGYLGR